MAKRVVEAKPAASKPAASKPEDSFVELMLVAADFVKNCGGLEHAKKALTDAGRFVDHAGSVNNATKALDVLESLKDRIGS